jgi:hypothetical protein
MLAIHWPTSREYCRVVIGRFSTTAAEQKLTRLLIGGSDVAVDRLSGLLRHLEPDRLAGLLLAHGCTLGGVTMGRNVFELQADDVTPSQLAIDG